MKNYLSILLFFVGITICLNSTGQSKNTLQKKTDDLLLNDSKPIISTSSSSKRVNGRSGKDKRESLYNLIWESDLSNAGEWFFDSYPNTQGAWEIGNTFGITAAAYFNPDGESGFTPPFAFFNAFKHLAYNQFEDENAFMQNVVPFDFSDHYRVEIVFDQYYRSYFFDSTFVEISSDSTTWYSIKVNEYLEVYDFAKEPIAINISEFAGGKSKVWVRFRFQSLLEAGIDLGATGGMGWVIDNIRFREVPTNDLIIVRQMPYFIGESYFSNIPYDLHANQVHFMADIQSYGYMEQPNTTLNAKVYNSLGTLIYDESSTPQTFDIGAIDTIQIDTDFIGQNDSASSYDGYVEVYSDMVDFDSTNNHYEFSWEITDSVLCRNLSLDTDEEEDVSPLDYIDAQPGDAVTVNFETEVSDTVTSISFYIRSMTGIELSPDTFLFDTIEVQGCIWEILSPIQGELKPVFYTEKFSITEPHWKSWVTLPFKNPNADQCILDPGEYLFGVMVFADEANEEYLSFSAEYNSTFFDPVQSTLLNFGKSPYNQDIQYAISNVPRFLLNFGRSLWVDNIEDNENVGDIKVFPNPSNNIINITGVENANIQVFNILGEKLIDTTSDSIQTTIDLGNCKQGTYILRINQKNNLIIKKINIIR